MALSRPLLLHGSSPKNNWLSFPPCCLLFEWSASQLFWSTLTLFWLSAADWPWTFRCCYVPQLRAAILGLCHASITRKINIISKGKIEAVDRWRWGDMSFDCLLLCFLFRLWVDCHPFCYLLLHALNLRRRGPAVTGLLSLSAKAPFTYIQYLHVPQAGLYSLFSPVFQLASIVCKNC